MKPIKIKGVEYVRLAVSGTKEKALDYARQYLYETEMPYTDTTGRVTRANGKATNLFILQKSGRWYLLYPVHPQTIPLEKTVNNQQKPTTMTKQKTTTKKRAGANTMRCASKILKAQKADYQKIFRTEVKKSKNPKEGAKKAGRIYRDRYGATAEARWEKALKRAK